ncbi:MAG: TIGR03546 family protein [Spirochaetales bacterium]|jgi:uncharacterized protein (TIGR03546 family)|nr:TIGR03546 family protein [Spirochaetales bacterium]
MIKAIAKVFIAFNSNIRRSQIASGFAWGLLLGLVPGNNLIWLALFLISLTLKNNYAGQVLVMALVKLVLPALLPLLDRLGWFLLTLPQWQGFWTRLYNLPLGPFTRFNNTLVAGGLCAGVVLWLPLFLIVRAFLPLYRNKLAPRIAQSRLMGGIKKLPLVSSLIKAGQSASSFTQKFIN